MERDEAFNRLLSPRGRLSEIARGLSLSPAAVCKWKRIPAERAKAVSRLLGVPLHEIRPDLFDPPKENQPR